MAGHYKFTQNKKIYQINSLAFDGEIKLKRSNYIQDIIIPCEALLDTNNPNRSAQYERLIGQASYINYPQICVDNMLGLSEKGSPEVTVPQGMEDIVNYATAENQPLNSIQSRILDKLCRFGLAALKIDIENDASTTTLPRFRVISGNKIVDFKTVKNEQGIKVFKFILFDKTVRVFYQPTKIYIIKRRYQVCGLDENGEYYEALIDNAKWNGFNLDRPWQSDVIELVYPEFYGRLNFIPVVCLNPYHVRMDEEQNYDFTSAIQSLIDLSLNIFQQDANLKQSLHMQANPTLFVHGSNAKPKDVLTGPYAVNILKDSASKAEYVSPAFGGITIQKEVIQRMKTQAQARIYSILNAAGTASGDALSIRLQSATLNLVQLIKNIGDAITNGLEFMAIILGLNPDECKYSPYIGFGKMETGEQIKEETEVELEGQEQKETDQEQAYTDQWLESKQNEFKDTPEANQNI